MTDLGDLPLGNPIAGADVTNTPAGGIAATDVQGAINELDTEKPASGDVILKSIVDAKGDLIVGTGADTAARQAVGTDYLVSLTPDSTVTNGVAWSLPRSARRPTGSLYETFPRAGTTSAIISALTAQRLFMQSIELPAGLLVTSITFISSTTPLAVGVHQLFGLYDSSRALLRGTSDDTSTAWGATTPKTLNLTSTFTTTYAGLYYLGILVDASTVPTLIGQNTLTGAQAVAPIMAGNSTASITALPNPAGAITGGSVALWAWVN